MQTYICIYVRAPQKICIFTLNSKKIEWRFFLLLNKLDDHFFGVEYQLATLPKWIGGISYLVWGIGRGIPSEDHYRQVPFYKISAPEIVAGISGESEQKIRTLFATAMAQAPSIIFMDEIDAIAGKVWAFIPWNLIHQLWKDL